MFTDEEIVHASGMVRGYFINRRMPSGCIDDAVQEVLLAIVRNLEHIQCLKAYAMLVARHQYGIVLYRFLRGAETEVSLAHAVRVASPDNPLRDLEQAEVSRVLRSLVAALPARYREIMERSYFGDQSCERVCREMKISVQVMKNAKHRGTLRLAELIRQRAVRAALADQIELAQA